MALTHSDAWYETQNKIFGLPRGTRHQDAWYTRAHQQQNAQVAADQARALQKEIADTAARKAEIERRDAPPPPPPPPPPATPAGPTAEELAATAHAEAQGRETAARDAWDRLNSQGAYDLDGWQSIGYQPDRVGMPAGWAANNWLPPTPPAPPAPPPPPPADPNAKPPGFYDDSLKGATNPGGADNALTALVGPVAPVAASAAATPAMAQPAQASTQNAFAAQQPDAGAWGGQSSGGQTSRTSAAGTGMNQSQPAFGVPGVWGTKKKRSPTGGATLWNPATQAGTWGMGRREE